MFRHEIKRFCLLTLAILICLISFPPTVSAYKISDYRLVDEIRYIPHQDFGSLSIAHMNDALYVWNEAMGEGLLSRSPTVRHTKTDYPTQDNVNRVYRVCMGQESGVLAENQPYLNLYWQVIESDININMSFTWANSAQPGKMDLWTVFMHEAGHTIGLSDEGKNHPEAVMYFQIPENHERRSLSEDDIKGVRYLFP